METTAQKAELARLQVELRAYELGAIISRPVSECGGRYDCIIDWQHKLYRAQIKYADGRHRKLKGAVTASLTKPKGKGISRPYTKREIDVLLVYVPIVDRVCWLGPEIWQGKTKLSLRYAKALSNRYMGCIRVEEYFW